VIQLACGCIRGDIRFKDKEFPADETSLGLKFAAETDVGKCSFFSHFVLF
jgi:hypothetical protein